MSKWVGASLFIASGVVIGFAAAAVFITATWGGIFAAVACSDEQTNPASLCRNGYYAHGVTGWGIMAAGLVIATILAVVGARVSRVPLKR